MYLYCGNDPVNLVDLYGEFWNALFQYYFYEISLFLQRYGKDLYDGFSEIAADKLWDRAKEVLRGELKEKQRLREEHQKEQQNKRKDSNNC